MAYTAVPTVATGDTWTAANHNLYLKDNVSWFGVSHDHSGDLGDGATLAFVPANLIAYTTDTSAPSGWAEFTAGRGRVIVATPSGGTHAGTVGSALTDLQDPTHTHTGPSHQHDTPIRMVAGNGIRSFDNAASPFGSGASLSATHSFSMGAAPASGAAGLVSASGTGNSGSTAANTPYIQQLAIKKS
jgi:hypothetical protein